MYISTYLQTKQMLRRINKRIQSDCIAIELFTIDIHGGGHLSHVHNIHIEICARIIFVQVNLQQFVAASNVNHLQGTLHVHAFVSPSAVKSQQLQVESSRELFKKKKSDHGFDSLVTLSEDCVDLRGFCQGSSFRVDVCELQTHLIFQHSLVREAKLKDKGIAKCIRMETEGYGSKMAACRLSVFCLRSRNILQMNSER